MRNLTSTELQTISGGDFNYWRAGFDIVGGGLAGVLLALVFIAVQETRR